MDYKVSTISNLIACKKKLNQKNSSIGQFAPWFFKRTWRIRAGPYFAFDKKKKKKLIY